LVHITLGTYNRFNPLSVHMYKMINAVRQFTFTVNNTPVIKSNGVELPSPGAPEWLVEIIPVRISGVYPFYLRDYDRPRSNLDIKVEFPWEYRKPTLTVPVQGEYDIHAVYYHQVRVDASGEAPTYHLDTITDRDDVFLKLLTGRFLKATGRNRRAFVMADLPITTDASELVSEGTTMEQEAMEEMTSNSKFYLAWR
jgi:hypothetical protein